MNDEQRAREVVAELRSWKNATTIELEILIQRALQAAREDERARITKAVKATAPEIMTVGVDLGEDRGSSGVLRTADGREVPVSNISSSFGEPGRLPTGEELARRLAEGDDVPKPAEPEKRRTIEEIRSGPQTYDALKAVVAQRAYCAEKSFPNFAGGGICFSCNRSVFERLKTRQVDQFVVTEEGGLLEDSEPVQRETGISVQEAAATLVTGCPHCHRTFCD